MPRSSSVFTSEASVKRGGGCVKCCLGSRARSVSTSPTSSGGITASALLLGHRLGLLPGLDVDRHEARELERRALGAEQARARLDVGRHRVVDGGQHLAREEALPDQPVQRELVLAEIARQLLRLAGDRARPDRLVRLLRALLRPVHRRRVRQVLAAQPAAHPLARLLLRLGRDPHRVRAHVGDEARPRPRRRARCPRRAAGRASSSSSP